MSRYLTPSKIALLALTSVYGEGLIPTSEITGILSFLISQLLPDPLHPLTLPDSDDANDVTPIAELEKALSGKQSIIIGRKVWDVFLKKLWALDCAASLDSFFSNMIQILAPSRAEIVKAREVGEEINTGIGKILRSSPLGAFIRRAHLEHARLQFHDAIALWQTFLAYRLPTKRAWEKRNPSDGRNTLDINLSEMHIDGSHLVAQIAYGELSEGNTDIMRGFSSHDKERLMEFQVSELQRLGGRLPSQMSNKLKQMSQHSGSMPHLGHYLKFLDSWRMGDYHSAFDNLYRYFDYTMQSRDRTFYQYALLNLAILQADFGCHSEAVPAMQEAISTARENKDITCLNFCMSWLYHFGKAFPTEMKEIRESGMLGNEVEGLAFLKTRAKDAEMWSLLSTTLLSEAKMHLSHGDSLAVAFESITKAAHLNVIKNISNAMGPTMIMKGSVFARLGQSRLTWSNGETFLQCYTDDAPMEDILKCTCRMASLLAQRGRYRQAMQIMEDIPRDILRVLKYQQYWTFYARAMKLRRHLHRNDIRAAQYLLEQLRGQGAPDTELDFMLSLLQIDYELRQKNHETGLNLVEDLAKKQHPENIDVLAQIRLLNIKAKGLADCGSPFRGFSLVMRAANMANRARVLPVLWESVGILSHILGELKDWQAAAKLVEAIIPQVLECRDCFLSARTYSYLVDAYAGMAGQGEHGSTKRREKINKAIEYINDGIEQYRRMEDLNGQLDLLSKKAVLLKYTGDMMLANDIASQYLALKKEYAETRPGGTV